MDFDTLSPGHKAEDIISENRIAAAGHRVLYALHILGVEHKYIVSRTGIYAFPRRRKLSGSDFLLLVACQYIFLYYIHIQVPAAYCGKELNLAAEMVLLAEIQNLVICKGKFPVLEPALKDFAPLGGKFALSRIELLTDFGPRL